MTTIDELESRLAELELRAGIGVEPLAANPPITVGELADVPAPGSAILSAWTQEVSNRIIHRFANATALTAWAAAAGSQAITLDTGRLWTRIGTTWVRSGWADQLGRTWYAAAAATPGSIPPSTPTPLTWNETVDSDNFAGPSATVITIPAGLDGLYAIQFHVLMGAATTNGLIRIVTTGTAGLTYDSPITVSGQIGAVTAVTPLAAANTIQGQVYHTSAAAVGITSGTLYVVRLGR